MSDEFCYNLFDVPTFAQIDDEKVMIAYASYGDKQKSEILKLL